ncbi:unnamed protein product [Dibothriocephalus latus]|uniref:Uncharacterized protein n=1 Tax=Dibothriocephalus latus TaxID=60516 RepID=A0A3P7MBP8_DIBLA|nr:unnamed protein product [Dibothriocephalus latus]
MRTALGSLSTRYRLICKPIRPHLLYSVFTPEKFWLQTMFEDRFSADHMKIDPSIEHVVDYPLYSLDGNVAAIVEVQRNAAAGTFDDTDVKVGKSRRFDMSARYDFNYFLCKCMCHTSDRS